jgi:hypothetical protein
MTDQPDGIHSFNASLSFYVQAFGVGIVSPTITEMMPAEMRPAYCLGAGGWRGTEWGKDDHDQWIASWKSLAGLHGLLDALRAELPEELRREYAQLRLGAVPQGRRNLQAVVEAFRRDTGAE